MEVQDRQQQDNQLACGRQRQQGGPSARGAEEELAGIMHFVFGDSDSEHM